MTAPVATGRMVDPPEILCDINNNAATTTTNLYRISPVQDLSRMVDPVDDLSHRVSKFDFFQIGQAATVGGCQIYSNCNMNSSTTEVVVHNSLITSVFMPNRCDNTMCYEAADN